MITFEVVGYEDEHAFHNNGGVIVQEDIISRNNALKIGRRVKADYPIVKVRSSEFGGEYTEILR